MYRRTSDPIAFVDESYELRSGRRFYMFAAVVVPARAVFARSGRLHRAHPGLIHATEFHRDGKLGELAHLTKKSSRLHDAAHIFMAPIPVEDETGEATRAALIRELASVLTTQHGASTLVFDSRVREDADRADQHVVRHLRRSRKIPRHVAMVHTRPSREKLLQAADLLASAYRQKVTRGDRRMIDLYAKDKLHFHGTAAADERVGAADAISRIKAASAPPATPQGRVAAGAPGGAGGQFASKVNSAPSSALG